MKVGVVLSGGFAKGAYQLGALRAISEYIPLEDITCVSGSSIGTVNAFAYITKQMDSLIDMWMNIFAGKEKMFIADLLKSELLQQDISNICEKGAPSTTFYTTLFDITEKAACYKDLSKVTSELCATYLKASIAFPVYNKAVEINGHRHYDGGFLDNIPVYPLMQHDLDYIICVYFDDIAYRFEDDRFDNKIIKVNFPNMSSIKKSFFLTPDDVSQMMNEGYERTMYVLRSMFADGYDNLETISKSIVWHNKQLGDHKLRLTTDVVITNVNKMLARYAKRKIIL